MPGDISKSYKGSKDGSVPSWMDEPSQPTLARPPHTDEAAAYDAERIAKADALVERVARAIEQAFTPGRDGWIDEARAAIAAIRAPGLEPDLQCPPEGYSTAGPSHIVERIARAIATEYCGEDIWSDPAFSDDGLHKERCRRAARAAIAAIEADQEKPYGYAKRLAEFLWEKHYKTDEINLTLPPAPDWKALPDLLGVLTQIDNMTTGLTRCGPGYVVVPREPTETMLKAGQRFARDNYPGDVWRAMIDCALAEQRLGQQGQEHHDNDGN